MTDQYTPISDITDDDKLWSLLSYIFAPLVPVIMILMEEKKNRPFIRYNAMQALVFGIIAMVINIPLSFVFVGCITGLAYLGYAIYLGIQAYNGKIVTIPVLTDFCKKQGWL